MAPAVPHRLLADLALGADRVVVADRFLQRAARRLVLGGRVEEDHRRDPALAVRILPSTAPPVG
jgi:hypothetical protein